MRLGIIAADNWIKVCLKAIEMIVNKMIKIAACAAVVTTVLPLFSAEVTEAVAR